MAAEIPGTDFESLRAEPVLARLADQPAACETDDALAARRAQLLGAVGGPDAVRSLARRVADLAAPAAPAAVPWLASLARLDPLWELQSAAIAALARLDRDAAAHAAGAAVDRAWKRNGRLWRRDEVLALVRAAPAEGYDRLAIFLDPPGHATERGVEVAAAVLGAFGARSWRRDGSYEFYEAAVPDWVAADPRWLRLAAGLRTDAQLGRAARWMLRAHDARLVGAALDAVAAPVPAATAPDRRARGDLVTRYRRGEHESVWRELRAAGAIDGALRDEALAVARETMARVAAACDQLAERLTAQEWTVLPFMMAREAPRPDDAEHLAAVEHLTQAPLPPSLRAFWEVVGGVNLIWDFQEEPHGPPLVPGVDLAQMDPLSISPPATCAELIATWTKENAAYRPELREPFALELAPDALHKANVSGGSPHSIALPFAGADPVFEDGTFDLPLVDYLRHCVRHAGFPFLALILDPRAQARRPRDKGAAAMVRANMRADPRAVEAFVRAITHGIEPF